MTKETRTNQPRWLNPYSAKRQPLKIRVIYHSRAFSCLIESLGIPISVYF